MNYYDSLLIDCYASILHPERTRFRSIEIFLLASLALLEFSSVWLLRYYLAHCYHSLLIDCFVSTSHSIRILFWSIITLEPRTHAVNILFCTRSVRHDHEPNIFSCGLPTQAISIYMIYYLTKTPTSEQLLTKPRMMSPSFRSLILLISRSSSLVFATVQRTQKNKSDGTSRIFLNYSVVGLSMKDTFGHGKLGLKIELWKYLW